MVENIQTVLVQTEKFPDKYLKRLGCVTKKFPYVLMLKHFTDVVLTSTFNMNVKFEPTLTPNRLDLVICLKCFIVTATSITTMFFHFICLLSLFIFFLNSWQCDMLILKTTTTAPLRSQTLLIIPIMCSSH